ncbi:dimethyladenosine transferase [Kribbella sandramycini]|uniref:Dimethyladenosine transferase n=1 Tax=Kribbella sandramycini TaxID=60450 RepID=A0A7Y4P0N8_9ACTN|nr:SRPBCC family protein [Kribbella sandramycini]MBB6568900.1 uncharacterized protein YndB with AHSA1/START domain [Kribbella sandramycini]NOL41254.1 dimethyladenosine transferase [Kribbella sandramycini]
MTDGVEVELRADQVSAETVVAADAAAVFEFLRRPANHAVISGDRTVRDAMTGAAVLGPGDRFGMAMRIKVPYRVTSRVVEFEQDRLIAWCHFFGHRWRWELEPIGPGQTRVRETFDLGTARIPAALRLIGLPAGHRGNVAKSVRNVAAHFRSA